MDYFGAPLPSREPSNRFRLMRAAMRISADWLDRNLSDHDFIAEWTRAACAFVSAEHSERD
jgi:hypothetical protein